MLLYSLFSLSLIIDMGLSQSFNGVFALTWLQGFCQAEQKSAKEPCDLDQYTLWDQQSFTIHGLWVDRQTTKSKYGRYNRSIIYSDEELLQKMANFFPPAIKLTHLIDDPEFLWKHELNKHMPDFAVAVQSSWEEYSTFKDYIQRNQVLHWLFFSQTIRLYESLGARKIPKGLLTKKEMGNVLGIAENHFNIVCFGRNKVKELRICFEIDESGIQVSPCPNLFTNCKDKVLVLGDWQAKNQTRVTAFPNIRQDNQGK